MNICQKKKKSLNMIKCNDHDINPCFVFNLVNYFDFILHALVKYDHMYTK
jgi:hypothetical protein